VPIDAKSIGLPQLALEPLEATKIVFRSVPIDRFEVPHQQQTKVDSGSETRASRGGRIELLALPFHKSVEIVSREKFV
jgi:hypothetical protein